MNNLSDGFRESGHLIEKLRKLWESLDISEVNTVWTWGDKRPPPISKYFSEIFSPSHINLTNNNHKKNLNRSSAPRKSRNLS